MCTLINYRQYISILLANLQSRSLYATIQRTLIADPLVPITVHETADNLSALGSQPGLCLRTVAGDINDFAGGGRNFYCRGSSGLLESEGARKNSAISTLYPLLRLFGSFHEMLGEKIA